MSQAKIIADSISPAGVRITTLELSYWRAIHGELLTHRALSRNSMSSRAVPVAKMIQQVRDNPAGPSHWGANQPGMQARQELTGAALAEARLHWTVAAKKAADIAESMCALGLHKQVANRVLEPFQLMRTLVTATDWGNFFELRDHPDAQPEFQELAQAMRQAMDESEPEALSYGEWHLPYVTAAERQSSHSVNPVHVSAARCARVSYLLHDGEAPDIGKDLALFDRLVGSVPRHASPIEHQATPKRGDPTRRSYNFRGWTQFRELYEAIT